MKDLLRGPAPSVVPSQTGSLEVCSVDYLGSMLGSSSLYVDYVGLMLAYAGFMLAYVGSSCVKLVHVASSWPKLASRCVYVGSSWPQDAQDGLPRSPKGQISSFFDPNLVILEHPESSKY